MIYFPRNRRRRIFHSPSAFLIAVVLIPSALLSSLLVFAPQVQAQAIIVTDCYGLTRALKSVKGGSKNIVRVEVKSATGTPANGSQVTLTNATTGEVAKTTAVDGVATFNEVSSGVFSVATETTGVTMGSVAIQPVAVAAGLSAGALTGVAAGTGGTVAIGAGGLTVVDEVQKDDPNPDDGGGDDGETPPAGETPGAEPTPDSEPTPSEQPEDPDCPCEPDAEPTPLPPFVDGPEPAAQNCPTGSAAPLSPFR